MNSTKGDRLINLPTVNFPTQDGKLKPKSENSADVKNAKPELENKRKSSLDAAETRINMSLVADTESSNEFVSRTTYQIIPSTCISSNSAESNSMEITEQRTTRYIRRIL